MLKETLIPEFYSVLTKEGWESLETYKFRIPILVLINNKLTYCFPKIWSKRHYEGKMKKLSTKIGPFYLPDEPQIINTYIDSHPVKKVTEYIWEGTLFSFDFNSPVCSLPLKVEYEYLILPINN